MRPTPTDTATDGEAAVSPTSSAAPGQGFILLLVAVAAVSPLGINIYLPSMPGMAVDFGVDFAAIQLTLSLYLLTVAIGQLFIGPLSDRYGRRPVLLGGLASFVLGSLLCLIAANIELLLTGRVLQALGGCAGITLSRAVVRDLYGREQAASMIGYVTMGMAVAPMLAPSIGGALDGVYGWQASFVFLLLFSALTLAGVLLWLPETNRHRGPTGAAGQMLRGYAKLGGSRLFWGYALTTAFNSAVFFSFVAGASYVMVELMNRTPLEYGIYFGVVSLGYILGNFFTARRATTIGPNRLILAGSFMVLASVAAMAVVFSLGYMHPLALFMPMFFVGVGNGMVMPSGVAGAISVKPEAAGTAAGLSGSLQMGCGALAAPLVGALLGGGSIWPMIGVMAVWAALGIAAFALVGRAERR